MAKVNTNKNKPDEKLLDLVEVQQKTKSFFEHNQKLISITVSTAPTKKSDRANDAG